MNISIELIKELRMKTGSGFLECKKALQKNNGNLISAIDYLRTLGACIAEKKTLHQTQFGRIFLYINKNIGALLELNSETDFVCNNDEFKKFGQKIVEFIVVNQLFDIKQINDVFKEELISYISKFQENIIIQRIQYIKGDFLFSYLHLNKIGVIVSGNNLLNNSNEEQHFKNIAMHIAAANPVCVLERDVPESIINREMNIQKKIAYQSGKSEHVLNCIINGRMNKFIKNLALLSQNFIINPKITVSDYLKQYSISVSSFIRFQVGEKT